VVALLLYRIIFRRRKRKPAQQNQKSSETLLLPGLDSEFYRLEKKLAARGLPRSDGETLSDWLERALTEPALADLREPLRELLRLHYRLRFDPPGLTAADRQALAQKAAACLQALSQK
jgi:hypothetical protein